MQGWILLNIDKRQTSGNLGKLLEFWSSGTGRDLIYRLLIPTSALSTDAIDAGIGGWAGDRIICVGDDNEEVPDNLLTQAEQDALGGQKLHRYGEANYDMVLNVAISVGEKQAVYPLDKTWVLRNLSKKVYVHLDELEQANGGGLEQALLCFISWSSDPSTGAGVDDFDTRGGWAGDRFDVSVVESVEGDGGAWTDVSAEVIGVVEAIWNQCDR